MVFDMLKKIKNSEHGVVGIVVAVLLIGLLVSVVSLLQMVYVPKWMEQREAEHMDEVNSQFSQLKFAIDTQSSTSQLNTPIASSITLGSKELPYLMSIRSYGQLEILSDSFKLSIVNASNTYNYSFGTIKYSSSNAYFLDQTFIYEAGSIIISQQEGNMISVKPPFYVFDLGGVKNISINIADINGIGGKTAGGGYGTTAIQTEYAGFTSIMIQDISQLDIVTNYPNAWCIYLDLTLKKVLDSPDYLISLTDDGVNIQFFNSPNVELKIVDINAQIGAGWIE
jgi:hypothetical protein